MKKPTKKPLMDDFEKAQLELIQYVRWLEESSRLTVEEHDKLLTLIAHDEAQAIEFGLTGEDA